MKRMIKYLNTETFVYFNANPKNRITGDCAFRSISLALGQDYNQTVMEMAKMMCETGYALNDAKGETKYLLSKGYKILKQPRKTNGKKYTGAEFCKEIAEPGKKYICHIGGHHVVCVKDCKIHDIWDCSKKTVGNYWCIE